MSGIKTPSVRKVNKPEEKEKITKIARRTTGAKGFYPVHNIDTP